MAKNKAAAKEPVVKAAPVPVEKPAIPKSLALSRVELQDAAVAIGLQSTFGDRIADKVGLA